MKSDNPTFAAMKSPSDAAAQLATETVIRPRRIVGMDLRELWEYRDLLAFLVWRDIKARYAQSVLGIGWALIQPVFSMIVFTIIFGRVAKISSDGVPYALFSYCGLVCWTYFSGAVSGATDSLVASANVLTKVYFPRVMIPLTPVMGRFVDFCIAFSLLLCLIVWFGARPTGLVVVLPLLILIMMGTAAGIGLWMSALAIQYRDVKYAMGFMIQLAMYAAPVVYPSSRVPEEYRLIYGLNPMAGVIEGFRSAMLGSIPMPWDFILSGAIICLLTLTSGLLFFKYRERIFADVA